MGMKCETTNLDCTVNGYHYFVWVEVKIKCSDCGQDVEGYTFPNAEKYQELKDWLYCDDCAPDIPF